MIRTLILDGFIEVSVFQFHTVIGKRFEVFERCGRQFCGPDKTITLLFEMDRMESQLCCPKDEDTGYRHGDEKLDHRKPTLFLFFKSEKKNHFNRPSIAKILARDVPFFIALDFRENRDLWN